jgi:hypothetical protein
MPSSIRKVLNELPTTLDDTYERALQEIPKEKCHHAHHLFRCLVGAIRPLRVEELAEIFAINFEADSPPDLMEEWRPENPEEAVLSTCSTLVTVIEDKGSKIVQFCHFSVKEYLTSDRLRTSDVGNIGLYYIPLDAAHTILARSCLAVLLRLDENVDKKRLATFPLAFYAAQYWVDHAKFEDVALRIQDGMERLFHPGSPYLAAWLWINDVDRGWFRRSIDDLTEHPSRLKATALYYVALCGFSGVANYLICTHGEDVNALGGGRGTPLRAASRKGHLDVVHLLLQHNADVNDARGPMNWTALHEASDYGDPKVVNLLLEHGAEVNVISSAHNTPLWCASFWGHLEVVQMLLEHGADVHIRGEFNRTPYQDAMLKNHIDVARLLLLEHGAKTE